MVKVAFLIAPAASSMKPVFYREIVHFSEDNLQMTIELNSPPGEEYIFITRI